jgi:excisionase family DNA binding protein
MDTTRALSVVEFGKRYGIGRSKIYEEIKGGRLRAIKNGRRTLIIVDDAEAWLHSQPAVPAASRISGGSPSAVNGRPKSTA